MRNSDTSPLWLYLCSCILSTKGSCLCLSSCPRSTLSPTFPWLYILFFLCIIANDDRACYFDSNPLLLLQIRLITPQSHLDFGRGGFFLGGDNKVKLCSNYHRLSLVILYNKIYLIPSCILYYFLMNQN